MGSPSAAQEEVDLEFHHLTFGVNKFCRYHEKLRTFYWWCSDFVKIVTVISGSGIVALLFAEHAVAAGWFSAGIALLSLIDIVWSPGKTAQTHDAQYRAFKDLSAQIRTAKRTAQSLNRLQARRERIEISSPPIKRLVEIQARNDECRAQGYPPDCFVPLSAPQQLFGYFFTFGMAKLERWKAEQHKEGDASTPAPSEIEASTVPADALPKPAAVLQKS